MTTLSNIISANVNTIPVGNGPSAIAYNSDKDEMYVTNDGSNSVSVIAKDKYPSGTTILFAMSSDVRVLNNSESEVDSITFYVSFAIAGLYPVSGFPCSLGIGYANGPFQSCGSRLDPSGVSTIENDLLKEGRLT